MMTDNKTSIRYPWMPCILNGLILWIICLASREMLVYIRSGALSIIIFEAVFASIPAGFLIGISIAYQLLIYNKFKEKTKKALTWWILFLLPSIAIGGISLYYANHSVRARIILSNANLANLPESAHDISTFTWSSPMSGEEYLKFKASLFDIELFLAASPILKNKECVNYTEDKMRLVYPEDYKENEGLYNTPHEYFFRHPMAPNWYKGEIEGIGRRYEIQPDGYHCPGEVIIDDEAGIVFVYLIFS